MAGPLRVPHTPWTSLTPLALMSYRGRHTEATCR